MVPNEKFDWNERKSFQFKLFFLSQLSPHFEQAKLKPNLYREKKAPLGSALCVN